MGTGDGLYHYYGSWHDDPSIPYASLIGHIAALKAGEEIERPTEELARERDRLAEEYGALLDEEAQPTFEELLGLSRTVFPYVEEHKFYCDYWFQSRFFNKVREFGALLAKHGFIEDGEDIFNLSRHEAMEALEELVAHVVDGRGPPLGPHHWPPIVARRKELLERLGEWTPPPALGAMPEAVNDPIVVMLWGITPERLKAWARLAGGRRELSALRGLAGRGRGTGARGHGTWATSTRSARARSSSARSPRRVGADLLQDRRHRHRHRRDHVPRRDRLARVRAARPSSAPGTATSRIKTGQRLRVNGSTVVVTILDGRPGGARSARSPTSAPPTRHGSAARAPASAS